MPKAKGLKLFDKYGIFTYTTSGKFALTDGSPPSLRIDTITNSKNAHTYIAGGHLPRDFAIIDVPSFFYLDIEANPDTKIINCI